LKQGPGGLTDIEFLVQYAVLRWAGSHPELLPHTDNRHLLAALGETGLLAAEDSAGLTEAYFAYRGRLHALALKQLPARVGEGELVAERARVSRLWRQVLGE
jgi:glutamate-ammonia-ligase adenylyltransferase